jgi:hypothetical protein
MRHPRKWFENLTNYVANQIRYLISKAPSLETKEFLPLQSEILKLITYLNDTVFSANPTQAGNQPFGRRTHELCRKILGVSASTRKLLFTACNHLVV